MIESYFPLIIAHRGAPFDAYENSLEAFQLAIDQKADMIELDAHLTKDGHFIVFHDSVIKYGQQGYRIANTPLKKIQVIKLPNDEQIPLLRDVLTEFHSKIRFNIELKCSVKREQFDGMLKDTGIDTSKTVVSSFINEVHMELKDSNLEYELAYLYFFPSSQNKRVAQNDFIKAMNPQYRFLSKKTVKTYHSLKKKVYPWTVDDAKAIKNLVKKQVDGIITNKPKETREIINSIINN